MKQSVCKTRRILMLVAALASGVTGCTKYNPSTGQQEVDYGATAGVAGAAMGAAALGVALSNNNDDRYYYGGGPAYYGGGYGGGARYNRASRNSYNKVNNVHVNVDKSARRNNVNRVNRQARVNNNVGNRQARVNRNVGNRQGRAQGNFKRGGRHRR